MRRTTTLTMLLALACAPAAWSADGENPKQKLDRRKSFIESPLQAAVARKSAPVIRTPKKKIEQPTERVVAASAAEFENPRVAAGKVRWHADLDAARQAARRSGRPVLLFQLLGKLDERFC